MFTKVCSCMCVNCVIYPMPTYVDVIYVIYIIGMLYISLYNIALFMIFLSKYEDVYFVWYDMFLCLYVCEYVCIISVFIYFSSYLYLNRVLILIYQSRDVRLHEGFVIC